MNIKNSFVFIQSIFKFAFTSSMVFTALFFYSIFSASAAAGTIVLNAPVQSCSITARVVDLSWSSTLGGSPTFVILRKKVSEAVYAEIGSTGNLAYQDNTALSDQNYQYQIQVSSKFSNEVTASANYCSAKFKTPEVAEAECKNDGPRNNLAWIGATGTVSKYEIYRKNETAGDLLFSKIGETLPGVIVYSDGPGIIGTNTYIYLVRTVWQDGTGVDSEQRSIATLACSPILTADSTCNAVSPGGPAMNLSWNNLLGVTEYKIYRDVNGSGSSLLVSVGPGVTAYTDNLISGLPVLYWENANIGYSVKAVWGVTDNKISTEKIGAIMRCAPFLSVNAACDDFGNPAMNLSWTKTKGTEFYYNKYKDNTIYLGQQQSNTNIDGVIEYLETIHTDNLTLAECPGGQCTHSYRVDAKIDALTTLPSNTVSQDINCALNPPPSPPPTIKMTSPSTHCESGKSIVDIEWSSSDYASYYTLYRTDQFGNTVNSNTSTTSFRDASIAGNTQYTYYLVAHGRGGASTGASKPIVSANCVVPSIPVLNPVTKACVSGNPKTSLTWSATANTINYDILRKISSDSSFSTVEPSYNLLAWDDSSVLPSTSYDYQIKAKGAVGVDPSLSIVRSITTDSCAPASPVVTLTNSCPGGGSNPKVNISWTVANLDNVISYEVYRDGEASPILLVPKSGLSYSFDDPSTTLSHGGTYKYQVIAIGYSGKKTLSSLVPITLYNCVLPGPFTLSDPPAPSCFGPQPRVQLSWTNSTNVSTYNLLRARSSPATLVNVASPYNESLRNSVSGNSLSFNGSSYVNFGLTYIPLTGDLTIEFWANPLSLSYGRQNPICKSYGAEFCLTMETNGQLSYYHGSAGSNSSPYMSFNTPNVFENNKWVHVIITRNKATRTMKSYKNGNFANSGTWTSGYDPVASTYNLFVGKGYVNNFKGLIDEVRIYNRVLSSTEALEHYQGNYTVANEADLIGLWHFDEGSGQIVSDSSIIGKNGTLGNSASVESADPSWSIREITPQTDYDWTVIANNLGGTTSSNTITSYRTSDCPPARPNLVFTPECSAVAPKKSQMKLSWPYSINAAYYEIYRDGNATPIQTLSQNIDPAFRIWTDTNLDGVGVPQYFTDESIHNYYIKAITAVGAGNQSDTLSVKNLSCSTLSAPINLNVVPLACSGNRPKISFSWDSVPGATYYRIYRSGGAVFTPVDVTGISYEDSNLDVNTVYTYFVAAGNAGGLGPISSPGSSITTSYCPPSVPVVDGTPYCTSQHPDNQITWTDSTPYNTDKYEIYRGTVNNFADAGTVLIKTINKGDSEFTTRIWRDYPTPPLTNETSYYYWVKTLGPNPPGYFALAAASKTITTLFCDIPSSTSSITAVFLCSGSNPYVALSWIEVPTATSYDIYRNGVFLINDASGSPYTYDDIYPSVQVNTAYGYTIRARNNGGPGPVSSETTIPIGNYCIPSKPVISSASTACVSNAPENTVTWTDSTPFNASNYEIYRNNSSDFIHISGFENVTFPPPGWTTGGSANWYRDTSVFREGSASAASGAIGDSLSTYLRYPITVSASSLLKFSWKVSSEQDWDFLLFCLDNDACTRTSGYTQRISGEVSFEEVSIPLSAGTHSLRWVYAKDSSWADGNDAGWIDNVKVVSFDTAVSVQTVPQGTLSWTNSFGLASLTDYVYWVKTLGPAGTSPESDPKLIMTSSCAGLSDPANLAVMPLACSGNKPQVRFSWNSVLGADYYTVYRRDITAGGSIVSMGDRTESYYDDADLNVNNTYEYSVKARNALTESSLVTAPQFNTGYCAPTNPVLNPASTACVSGAPENTVSWTDSTSFNTTNYEIYRNNASDFVPISGFESATFPPPGWTTGGDSNWYRDTVIYREGIASTASGAIGNNQSNYLRYPITVSASSLLKFSWKVSSESGWDYLLFCLDNDACTRDSGYTQRISGEVPFTEVSIPLTAGNHSLRWVYAKDGSAIGGSDKGWIDNVQVVSVASSINLQTVNKGTLLWVDNAGLAPLANYAYWVKAVGPAGSGYSNVQSTATYSCGTKPNTLTLGLAPGSPYCWNDNPYADFTWSNVPNAYSYNLYRNNISDSIQSSYSTVISPKTDSGSKVMQFDGNDDYVIKNPVNNFPTTEITAEFWMKSSDTTKNGTPVSYAVSSNDNEFSIYNYKNFSPHIKGVAITTGVSANDGAWHHIAVTWRSFDGQIKLYKDGAVAFSNNIQAGQVMAQGGALVLGQEQDSVGDSFDVTQAFLGLIDEVRIYNRVLTASEIQDHRNSTFKNEAGLVALWHFDEKSGTTVIDSSGAGNDGKIGGPEWVSGKENNALDFGGLNSYVQAPSFSLGGATTIEAWVYSNNVYAPWARVMDFGSGSNSNNIIINWYNNTGRMRFEVYQGASSNSITTTDVFPQKQWVYVAAIADGAGNGYIYWNGVLKASGPVLVPNTLARTNQYIGKSNWSGDAYFNGMLDEVRIYSRSLSQTEIQEHKNGTFNNNTDLKALWHFDEKSGTTAYDSSSFGNNASLVKNTTPVRIASVADPVFSSALEVDKTYNYSAKAIGADTESDPSNIINFITSNCQPKKPDPFELNSQCDGASTQVLLSWPADTETSYWTIYKVGFPAFTKNITNNYYLDKDVASGASYQYKVEAFGKNGGLGVYSDTASVAIASCYDVPVRPVAITSPDCAGVASKMTVDWSRASYGKIIAGDLGAIGSNKTMIVSTGVLNAINVGLSYKVYLETQTSPATISVTAKSSGDNSVTYDVIAALEGGNGTDTEASILSNTSIGNGTIAAGDLSVIGFNKVMNTTSGVVSTLVIGSLYKVNLPTQTFPATIKVMAKSSPASFTYNVVTPLLGGNGSDTNAGIFSSKPLTLYDGSKTVSYNIYRKNITDGEPAYTNIFPNLPAAKRQVLDGGVVAEKEYSYVIEAIGADETILARSFLTPDSKAMSWNCANMPPFYPPDLSLNFTPYYTVSGGLVSLKWSDTQNETAYEIFRRVKGDAFFAYQEPSKAMQNSLIGFFVKSAVAAYTNLLGGKQLIPSTVDLVSYDYVDPAVDGYVYYNDLTVNEDIIYEYQVRALNGYGVTYSNIVSPVPVPIAPPGDFILDPGTLLAPKKLKLTWSEAAYTFKGGPVTYTLYKDSSDAFSSPTAVCANISGRECIDPAASGLAKFYKVVAHNNGGDTASNIISASATLKWREVIPK